MSAPRRLNFIHTSNYTGVPDPYGAASVGANQVLPQPRIFDSNASAKSAKSAPTIPNSTSSRLESMLTLGTSGTKEGSITANRAHGSYCTEEVMTRSTHSAGFESNTSNQVTLLALGYVGGSSGNRRAVAAKAALLETSALAGGNCDVMMPCDVKPNRSKQHQLDFGCGGAGIDEEQAVQEIEMPQDPLCGLRRPIITALHPLVSPPPLCLDGESCSDRSLCSEGSVSSSDDFPRNVARRPPPLRLASYQLR